MFEKRVDYSVAGGAVPALSISSEISSKVVETEPPTALTAPIMATAIKAAIKPYSSAVAPDSFWKNLGKGRLHSLQV